MCDSLQARRSSLQTSQEADFLQLFPVPEKPTFPSHVLNLASLRSSLIGDIESLLIAFVILKILIARY